MTGPTKMGMAGYVPKVLIRPAPPKPAPAATQVVGQQPAVLVTQTLSPQGVRVEHDRPPFLNLERAKYERLWGTHPEYRKVAPGEALASVFLNQARPKPGETVIDFGCGTGRAALMLALLGRVKVVMLDFAANCLDEDVQKALSAQGDTLRFMLADLEQPPVAYAKYGFCTDVMEHIPEDKVDVVLGNILKAAQHVFFQISTVQDHCGELIGETLHLTVRPFQWWLEKLQALGVVVHWAERLAGLRTNGAPEEAAALFYVSAWSDAKDLVHRGSINVSEKQIERNILSAIQRGFQEVRPFARHDAPLMILGGGPSLTPFWPDIERKRKAGMALVTVNGTYNQCLERGLKPSAQIVVDAREFNKRFVQPVVPDCKYLLASQCHPALFDAAAAHKDQVWLWHSRTASDLLDAYYRARGEVWYSVPGGSTAMLRGFSLLRMLGWWRFEVYGFDSCYAPDGTHHAFPQPENDGQEVFPITCGGRVFMGTTWMQSQAQEFIDQTRSGLMDEIALEVHGDGLIAHIIKTGAGLQEEEDRSAVSHSSLTTAEGEDL